jgi:hypothetical protein
MAIGMRHWWARAVTAGCIGMVALILCACVEVNQKSVIHSDFTGTTTMRIGISKVLIQTLASASSSLGGTPTANAPAPDLADPLANLKQQVADMGGTTTDYQDDNFIGIDATLPFTSLDQMVSQINNLLGSSAADGGMSGGSGPNAILTITTAPTATDGIRIDGDVDPLSELNDPGSTQALPGLDAATLLSGGGTIQIAFTMPGAIRTTDSLARTNGTTVSWSFNVGDKPATIFVEAEKG